MTATSDPCGIVINGQCTGTTTLVCTLDGAERPCTVNDEGFISNGMHASATTRGAFCAAAGVACSGSCSVQVGLELRSYACAGCVRPECEEPLAAACECAYPGGCAGGP